jgi:hypothetical protein
VAYNVVETLPASPDPVICRTLLVGLQEGCHVAELKWLMSGF